MGHMFVVVVVIVAFGFWLFFWHFLGLFFVSLSTIFSIGKEISPFLIFFFSVKYYFILNMFLCISCFSHFLLLTEQSITKNENQILNWNKIY